jgi:hypothetical protein
MNPRFRSFGRKAGSNTIAVARRGKLPACLSALSLLLLVGCSAEDPQIVALRQGLLMVAEPAAATTIAEAKAAAADKRDVLFIARVAEDEHAAFAPGKASFLVTEILPDKHGSGCKDDCPFCARKAAEAPKAAVQFIDESGEPLAVDSRKLLGVRPGDTVIVQGKGEIVPELDMLQVMGERIFVRSREEASK